ncbi:hypothetical protein E2562_037538 [Oryza meyeriana var. granulata]|uniref:Uncharacterized protein n=1 Tax=Oryza meyeriana var. granulata TaxID=110450 RepID=A0A6G1ECX5_9ORYZ|nr:hypothetical protein E2562_037538 [Oryza meyeriana var. granulata]KAF0922522.1 hypothetical protein E2562_037538 [Oryza meyeriana var. granulata]KAF0922523.1 hypothetical protein E2562_037538 [Oryza meyeriana var. granulata]KAF0922524.1 hypothetical protein E2562_037538 [Oryza meyeriana var. granulata]
MPRLPMPPPQLTSDHGNRDHRAASPSITTAVPFVPSRTPLASPPVNQAISKRLSSLSSPRSIHRWSSIASQPTVNTPPAREVLDEMLS